jgi:hypothetical protein
LSAVRLWLGDMLGAALLQSRAKSAETGDASGEATGGLLVLKQHVDNPGQTPMKDGGE